MSETDSFLRAIVEDPEDMAVRLIYADWLDEHGDSEQAEFIRLQCELSSLQPCRHRINPIQWKNLHLPSCHYCSLKIRECDAMAGAGGLGRVLRWLPFVDWGKDDRPRVNAPMIGFNTSGEDPLLLDIQFTFRRGFVEEVAMLCSDFTERGRARQLFSVAPIIRVGLLDKNPGAHHTWEIGDEYAYARTHGGPTSIPRCLWSPRQKATGDHRIYNRTYSYPTEAEAIRAISSACVRFGRRAAKLPVLKTSR